MNYELAFWKYQDGTALDHREVYERLSWGEEVEGVEKIPIHIMVELVKSAFTNDWKQVNETSWDSEWGGFQLFITPCFFRVDCYEMEGDTMNIFIDIAESFGCSLFDPQVNKRFDDS